MREMTIQNELLTRPLFYHSGANNPICKNVTMFFSELKSRQVYSADTTATGQMKLFKAPIFRLLKLFLGRNIFLCSFAFQCVEIQPLFWKGLSENTRGIRGYRGICDACGKYYSINELKFTIFS